MSTTLARDVADFLAHKRALGRKYRTEEATLRLLVAFGEQHRVADLAAAHAIAARRVPRFQTEAPRPQLQPPGRGPRLLSGLGSHPAAPQGIAACTDSPTRNRSAGTLPLRCRPGPPAAPSRRRSPRQFEGCGSRTDLSRDLRPLLRSGAESRGGVRPPHRSMSTSPRQLLVVRGGKFGKSRLVPYGPRIGELLTRQLEHRRRE